jgi:hypothetical protein
VKLGLLAGFSADHILFTPNCVDFEEIGQPEFLVPLVVQHDLSCPFYMENFGMPCC